MSDIKFTNQEKEAMVVKLQSYFEKSLAQELGQFDAEFLLDFVSKELGRIITIAGCMMRD